MHLRILLGAYFLVFVFSATVKTQDFSFLLYSSVKDIISQLILYRKRNIKY